MDRTTSRDGRVYASHAESSVPAESKTWYFAEGATHSGSNLFYVIHNQSPTAADVVVRYSRRPAGAGLENLQRPGDGPPYNLGERRGAHGSRSWRAGRSRCIRGDDVDRAGHHRTSDIRRSQRTIVCRRARQPGCASSGAGLVLRRRRHRIVLRHVAVDCEPVASGGHNPGGLPNSIGRDRLAPLHRAGKRAHGRNGRRRRPSPG